jgi:hypothetical protein
MAKVIFTNNNILNPIPVGSTKALTNPFQIAVTDTNLPTTPEILTVTLAGSSTPGTLSDALGGTFTGNTFTATTTPGGVGLQQILNNLTYTAAAIPNGTVVPITATIAETDGSTPPLIPISENLLEIGAPSINGVGPSTQSASSPDPIFKTVNVVDSDGSTQVSAVLTIEDNGLLTNTDGQFSSGNGLAPVPGKNGTFTIGPTSVASLNAILQGLVFQPVAVAAGSSITDMVGLTVTDATSGLSTTANPEEVQSQGAPIAATAPVISHAHSNQTAVNTPILPFNGVTITDTNANPEDTATLVVSGGGTLTGNDLIASATLGTFTIAAETPTQLQTDLDGLTFAPPALASGQASTTSSIALTVTNVGNALSSTDANTTITEGTLRTGNPGGGTSSGGGTNQTTTPDIVAVTAAALNISVTDPNIGEAYRLYQAALDRTPDQTGLTFWTNTLIEGVAPLTVASEFMTSPEFMADYGGLSIPDFVTTLYNNVLHRAPDPTGDAYWINALNSGASQANVLLDFSDSPENRANTAAATHTLT